MPKHGEQDGPVRQETIPSIFEGVNATTGEKIIFSYAGMIQTVRRRYCAYCQKWQEAKGIMGAIICIQCNNDWATPPPEVDTK